MNKTTIVLAFCATLLLTTSAAALVITQQPARKPAKRKGETDIATRVFTPTIKEGKRVIDRPASEDSPDIGPKAEVTLPKPDATVAANVPPQPVIETEGEPELITEYYPNGNLRAVYRGFKHKPVRIEGGTISVNWSSNLTNNCAVINRPALVQNDTSNSELTKEQREMFKSDNKLQLETQVKLLEFINSEDNVQSLGTFVLEIAATRHGTYESYFENGQLESRGEFDHGAYKGVWNFYYGNGQLRESSEFSSGQRQGHWASYYENGLRACESDWVNGVENGSHTDWFQNGLMCAQGAMKDGLRHGYWIFWAENGDKVREGNYENGNEVGDWQNYQPIKQQDYCEPQYNDEIADEEQMNIQIKTVIHTK
jgi:antitoxin component YwqK of YwqJK toxin-antitoxin module